MDLQRMLAAMGDGEDVEKLKARKERADKVQAVLLPDGEGRRMHEMSIRWTMFEVWQYGSELLGPKASEEHDLKLASLVRELTDFLIESKTIHNEGRVPAASWFKTIVSLKDMDSE